MTQPHRKRRNRKTRQRDVSIRDVRRSNPDYRKLSRAVIAMALSEAALEAAAQAERTADQARPSGRGGDADV